LKKRKKVVITGKGKKKLSEGLRRRDLVSLDASMG